MIKKFVKYMAFKHGKFVWLYKKTCKPTTYDYANLLKALNTFHFIGEGCMINPDVCVTDPKYVKIGNNTCLSSCTLLGHDGAIAIYAKSTGKVLDKVGKTVIGDNCFIGHGAILMPNITIGDNSIVAAGAVVSKDVEPGTIVGGVPAKVIGKTEDYITKIEEETKTYPWYDLIKHRKDTFDFEMEKQLFPIRIKYFFNDKI